MDTDMKRQPVRCPDDLYSLTPRHPAETIANLDRIPIRENQEPMIDLRVACPQLVIRPLSAATKTLHARVSVADRLNKAQAFLQQQAPGYQLVVVDAWRTTAQQARCHRFAKRIYRFRYPFWPAEMIREAANKYVAAPDAIAPPPHSTGGAIDVRLANSDGQTLCMGPRRPAACRTAYARLSAAHRHNRRLLCAALEEAGFSNYEEEWWHWSYGDSGWALRTNQPCALYGKWQKVRSEAKPSALLAGTDKSTLCRTT
jgi:D-alanyl-D-alanine dipeptidase